MKRIPLTKPYFDDESINKIQKDVYTILKSGRLILGPYTDKFEKMFKDYIGVKYAVAVNTCTSALTICLRHLNVQKKEVIAPSNTFVTVANSVVECGAKLVFGDMSPETLCLDIKDVKEKITKNTKAIIVIHMLGVIDPKIYELVDLCKKNGIYLIEDCSHAHGAMIDKRKAGSLGYASCFSFYPTKVMTTTLGGIIVTNDKKLEKYAKSLRFFGSTGNLDKIINRGNDWLLSEVNACIGIQQIKKLEENINRRNKIARLYEKRLGDLDDAILLKVPSNVRHSYYKFVLILSKKFNRDILIKKIKNKYNIETSKVYVPCHLHPLYRQIFCFKKDTLKITERILQQAICLPIYPEMTIEEINYVINCFRKEIKILKY